MLSTNTSTDTARHTAIYVHRLHSLPAWLAPTKQAVVYLALALCGTVAAVQPAMAAYSYSADGSEVTDSDTGLVWRRCVEGMVWSGAGCTGTTITFTHENALIRARTESASSGKAWRVPNVKELFSISKLGVAINPSIDVVAFPNTPVSYFWTSSPYVRSADNAWVVWFYSGYAFNTYRHTSLNVRLVR